MANTFLLIISLGGMFYFGRYLLAVIPALMWLLKALISGAVTWPGPIVRDPDPNANVVRARLGLQPEHLLPAFIGNTLGLVAAFLFFLMTALSTTPLLAGYIYLKCSWPVLILTLVALAGGMISTNKVVYQTRQLAVLYSNLAGEVSPQPTDRQSDLAGEVSPQPTDRQSDLAGEVSPQPTDRQPDLAGEVKPQPTDRQSDLAGEVKPQPTHRQSDLASKVEVEPRQVDGLSAESEYAIEHPLVKYRALSPGKLKALDLFYEGVRCHQEGSQRQALFLYQEALNIDSSLHQHAREALVNMAQGCSPADAGPIYYWLGAHSEYLMDLAQAAAWYEKAIIAFSQLGYKNRESRVHCNLGNVKMQMRDPSAMDEFEKAVALNPRNGTAYINIGSVYYGISQRGNPQFEQALDAFANAIVADPLRYGPIVISRLRTLGYTWREDLEDITQRVESKQR